MKMTGQQLKNSILQMAVQGKLVPQDPNDEPASVLLERIRAEKEALIKAGKIKKEKNPSVIFRGADNLPYEKVGKNEPVCIADEVPFDIPDSWEWVRLGMISSYAHTKQKINAQNAPADMWLLDLEDIEKGGRLLERKTVGERKSVGDKTFFEKGDILYSRLRPYLLKILVANDCGICTPEIVPFKVFGKLDPEYIVSFLKCPYVDAVINSVTYGVKMPRVGTETMTGFLVPIPPLSEQKRIVAKLRDMTPLIDSYSEAYDRASDLNQEFPDLLKKSILQEAIQGKLKSKNQFDESVSVLLDRIRAEKQALVKAGKIKKDKNESVIFRRDNSYYEKSDGIERCIDDEIPFEIPEHWCWSRLGQISTYSQRKEIINAQNVSSDIWGLDLEDIEKGGRLLQKISVGSRKSIGDKTVFKKGDILYSRLRPYLLKILVADDSGICTSEIVPFTTYGNIYNEFIALYLKSPYVDNLINTITYGVKMPRVGTETMVNLLVPLPPISEQYSIVSVYNSLLSFIEQL